MAAVAPDLKVSVFRDRNFKTPYYSNPYIYSHKKSHSVHIAKPIDAAVEAKPRSGSRLATNNTKSIITPFVNEKVERAYSKHTQIELSKKLMQKSHTLREKTPNSANYKGSYLKMKSIYASPSHVSPRRTFYSKYRICNKFL